MSSKSVFHSLLTKLETVVVQLLQLQRQLCFNLSLNLNVLMEELEKQQHYGIRHFI